jgi:hypothetical protein
MHNELEIKAQFQHHANEGLMDQTAFIQAMSSSSACLPSDSWTLLFPLADVRRTGKLTQSDWYSTSFFKYF